MNKLIITTLALGLSATAFAEFDPLVNEPGFYPEFMSQSEIANTVTNAQPEVGSTSERNELFDSSSFSYENTESKNR